MLVGRLRRRLRTNERTDEEEALKGSSEGRDDDDDVVATNGRTEKGKEEERIRDWTIGNVPIRESAKRMYCSADVVTQNEHFRG